MPSISIACIDTRNHYKAMWAVDQTIKCLQQAQVAITKVHWFSDQSFVLNSQVPITYYPIEPIKNFPHDYNYVCLKLLPEVLTEDFVIIVQHDGYAVNHQSWCEEFYHYDYIGAVSWSHYNPPVVGNGGFTLRSKKLLNAISVVQPPVDFDGEDAQICIWNRDLFEKRFAIKFAPLHIADKFSIEHWRTDSPWLGKSLGFHHPSIEPFYNKSMKSLDHSAYKSPDDHVPKTLLFCTSYAKNSNVWNNRHYSWISDQLSSNINFHQLLIVDDCSPEIPNWNNVHIQEANLKYSSHLVVLHRFRQRAGDNNFLEGWWRSFGYAIDYAIQNNFDRILHIESDAKLLTDQAVEWFNTFDQGWGVLWCPKHNFPEAALQVINRDQFESCSKFFQTPYVDHEAVRKYGMVPEDFMPFTHVNKNLVGDRYSEYPCPVPDNADYVPQVFGS